MRESKLANKLLFIKLLTLLGFTLLIYLVFNYTSLSISDFTPAQIKRFILSFGVIAPVIFISIYSLRGVILIIPVGIMSISGGLAFGKWWGTLYILIGAITGSCLSFFVARYLGRDFLERFEWMHKGRIKKFDEGIGKNGFKIILFMRLIPLFQYDAINFGAGLSKVKFRDYAIATSLGMVPGGFISATLGDSLENPMSYQFFIALGFFLLLILIPVIYKKIKKSNAKKNPSQKTALEQVEEGISP
jgi:uncharacterized membrane protein YdjX (TVP38/TMEM64 family)